jgi:hypothetical protein
MENEMAPGASNTEDVVNKTRFWKFLGVFIFMAVVTGCQQSPEVDYKIFDISGDLITDINRTSKEVLEKLKKDGSTLYIEFSRLDNNAYSQVSIDLLAVSPHKTFTLHELMFKFEGVGESVKINEEFKLNSIKEECIADKIKFVYHDYLYHEYNSIKIYLHDVFKKSEGDIGKILPVRVIVKYSFDGQEELSQQIEYNVGIYEMRDAAPTWLRKLFPEM